MEHLLILKYYFRTATIYISRFLDIFHFLFISLCLYREVHFYQ